MTKIELCSCDESLELIEINKELVEACKFVLKCKLYGPADRARDKLEKAIKRAEEQNDTN